MKPTFIAALGAGLALPAFGLLFRCTQILLRADARAVQKRGPTSLASQDVDESLLCSAHAVGMKARFAPTREFREFRELTESQG
jgi:hypothetical protein